MIVPLALRTTAPAVGRRTLVAGLAARQKHTLPDLPYDYDALEPVINTEIMRLHHDKHHQTYVTGLNQAEEKMAEARHRGDLAAEIELQGLLKFNGGGHVNHSIFWKNLAPIKAGGGQLDHGELRQALEQQWGSLDAFIKQFNATTAKVQGSGWGWLGYNPASRRLEIATCANQDPLTGLVPLLGVDVWEHAYYLQYKNVRPDYLQNIWKVVNWKDVGQRFDAARQA
ncbi:Superoxide dismutase [Mn], mitochondrial [Tieghemiomyces parasiticus]|uniref:Superoxide dismutase n=1 Tax=Tieghemiomyces parasiticus TaxID=78921 RepID=A0A9W8ABX7_9FUNG|nr:Superoxide dismutase [Mn], mitochondrial [Tieghemiomyces parasiticus]